MTSLCCVVMAVLFYIASFILCSHDQSFHRINSEYQGLDPDVRGPFPPSVFGSGVKIIPT